MKNHRLITQCIAICYFFMQWFQFTNSQDTSTQAGINFGTPLPTQTPQDLPLPACVGPFCNKCNIM